MNFRRCNTLKCSPFLLRRASEKGIRLMPSSEFRRSGGAFPTKRRREKAPIVRKLGRIPRNPRRKKNPSPLCGNFCREDPLQMCNTVETSLQNNWNHLAIDIRALRDFKIHASPAHTFAGVILILVYLIPSSSFPNFRASFNVSLGSYDKAPFRGFCWNKGVQQVSTEKFRATARDRACLPP